jgi:hypothetical protein
MRMPSPVAQTASPFVETALMVGGRAADVLVLEVFRAAGAVKASSELVRTSLGVGRPEAEGGTALFCAKTIGRSHIHREAINNLMKESA